MAIFLIVVFSPRNAFTAKGGEPIEKVKLQKETLPSDIQLVTEVWANDKQLQQVRLRLGSPIAALLNQIFMIGDKQAQVNYLSSQTESWLSLGYSNLIEQDGKRSFIFVNDSVLIQIAASTDELKQQFALLLKADPIFFLKPQRDQMPTSWALSREYLFLDSDLKQLQYELKAPIEASLSQDFVAGHTSLQIHYFHSTGMAGATTLVQELAATKRPFQRMLIGLSGSVVAVVRSQNEDLNNQAFGLIKWPTGQEVRVFPVE